MEGWSEREVWVRDATEQRHGPVVEEEERRMERWRDGGIEGWSAGGL